MDGNGGDKDASAAATLMWISGQEMSKWIDGNKSFQVNKHSR